jgi:hypothetical protein
VELSEGEIKVKRVCEAVKYFCTAGQLCFNKRKQLPV